MKNVFYILSGNLLIAFAIEILVIDSGIIAGGVSGLGIVLNHSIGISVSLAVGIINMILFLCGLIFMGKIFAAKTLISTFAFPLFLEILGNLSVFGGHTKEPLPAALLAGCLIGIGLAFVIKSGPRPEAWT